MAIASKLVGTNRSTVRIGTLAAAATAALLALAAAPMSASAATSTTIDFTSPGYTVGFHSPDTQNGWWMAKSVDFSLVDNSSFPSSGLASGDRSLQFSNATQLSGGAHLVSPTIEAAGEPSSGAVANTFDTTFTVASATGAVQPGLGVDVALDGASRYGGVVNLRHTDGQLEIGSYWYPTGGTGDAVDTWRSALFTRVDPAVPHVIRAVAVFLVDKPDTLDVYVDGTLVSAGTGASTWEAYSGSNGGDRSVDSLSFKTSSSAPTSTGIGYQSGLPAAPATAGKGFLFSAISYGVSTTVPASPSPDPVPADPAPAPTKPVPAVIPTPDPSVTAAPAVTLQSVIEQFGADTAALLETYARETGNTEPPTLEALFSSESTFDLSNFTASLSWIGDETVNVYGYSTPTYLGTFPVVNGKAQISGVDLSALGEGAHHLLVVGGQSGQFQLAQLDVPAQDPAEELPAQPSENPPEDMVASGLPLWVILGIVVVIVAGLAATVLVVRRRFV